MLIECRSGSPVRQVSALIPLVRIRGLSADSAGRRPGYRTVDGPDARLNGLRTVPDPAWLAGVLVRPGQPRWRGPPDPGRRRPEPGRTRLAGLGPLGLTSAPLGPGWRPVGAS